MSPTNYVQSSSHNRYLDHQRHLSNEISQNDIMFRQTIKVKSEEEPPRQSNDGGQMPNTVQRHGSNEMTFSRNHSYAGRTHHDHHINLQPNRPRESSPQPSNLELRRSSSVSSQYNFCNSCHLEHLRRLNDEEQRKLQEIEQIKREKETLIKSAVSH